MSPKSLRLHQIDHNSAISRSHSVTTLALRYQSLIYAELKTKWKMCHAIQRPSNIHNCVKSFLRWSRPQFDKTLIPAVKYNHLRKKSVFRSELTSIKRSIPSDSAIGCSVYVNDFSRISAASVACCGRQLDSNHIRLVLAAHCISKKNCSKTKVRFECRNNFVTVRSATAIQRSISHL